ncbi:UNVERIFIED_ORG: DNA-binding transcriptional LysR family regulator [Rhizobium esperanzae]
MAEDLAQGRLVALFPKARLDVEWGYDLVYAIGTQDHPKLRAFRSCISGEVREFASNIQPAFVDAGS